MNAIIVEDHTAGALLTEQPPPRPRWWSAVTRELTNMRLHHPSEARAIERGFGLLVSVAEAVPNLSQPMLHAEAGSLILSWTQGDKRRGLHVTASQQLVITITVNGVEQRQPSPTDLTPLVRDLQAVSDEPALHHELSTFVRALQAPSRPHASEELRALARRAVAARGAPSSQTEEEWADGMANLVIDGFDD